MTSRRSRKYTMPMPAKLRQQHVVRLMQWPLGSVMTRRAAGECWTDCIVELVEPIRLGGRYNTRRVRYDGAAYYVMHNGRRVEFDGQLVMMASETVTHVYGADSDADREHNKTLKGY